MQTGRGPLAVGVARCWAMVDCGASFRQSHFSRSFFGCLQPGFSVILPLCLDKSSFRHFHGPSFRDFRLLSAQFSVSFLISSWTDEEFYLSVGGRAVERFDGVSARECDDPHFWNCRGGHCLMRTPAKGQRTDLIPGGMEAVCTNCHSSVSLRHQTSTTPHDTVHWCVGSGTAVRTRGGEEKRRDRMKKKREDERENSERYR